MIGELTRENMMYMLGVENFEFTNGVVSEPMFSTHAHSIVIFNVDDSADIEKIKADIKANVDGYKWLCVGVEDENILVENIGNTIILIMDMDAAGLMESFFAVMDENYVPSKLSLEEVIAKMYETAALQLPMHMTVPLQREQMIYMLGVDNFEYTEGFVSEPMMGSFAHSIVLFTVNDDADIEKIKRDIKENVDGRKWICVGVEQEDILVDNVGNHIILIMDDEAQLYMDAFMSVMS